MNRSEYDNLEEWLNNPNKYDVVFVMPKEGLPVAYVERGALLKRLLEEVEPAKKRIIIQRRDILDRIRYLEMKGVELVDPELKAPMSLRAMFPEVFEAVGGGDAR